jgi:hypothetical protein
MCGAKEVAAVSGLLLKEGFDKLTDGRFVPPTVRKGHDGAIR